MNKFLFLFAAVISAANLGWSVPASAMPIEVSGSVLWAAGTPITDYTAPNATSNFGFQVDSLLPFTSPSATTSVTSFTYSLNGAAVTTASETVAFFDGSAQGMFDINLSNAAGTNVISIYGANVGNVGTSWIIGPYGTYPVTAATSQLSPTGAGTVTLSAVPLPGTLTLFGGAIVGMAGFAARRRAAKTAKQRVVATSN